MCAWELTEQSTYSTLWKAILSVFCGNISVLLSACIDWEDLLWAYLKVFIDIKVEEEIRSIGLKSFIDMPEQYWNFK